MSTREVSTRTDVYRNGVRLTTLRDAEDGEITMQREAAIKTSLYGSYVPDPLVDWLTDELRPVLVIDGEEYPCGVYLAATVRERSSEDGHVIEVDAYDRCWLVQSCRMETILHLDAGTYYLAAVAEINYEQLWFDAKGYARLEPVAEPTADSVQHVLDTGQINSLILPGLTREQDIFNTPNVFVCVCNNPDLGQTLTAEAINDNPQSPLSTIRRGRRIAQVVKVDNTPDQATLDAYAAKLRNRSLWASETVQVRTALLPGYGVGDTVGLVHPDAQGLYIEASWTLQLKPGGEMTHGLQRVVLSL